MPRQRRAFAELGNVAKAMIRANKMQAVVVAVSKPHGATTKEIRQAAGFRVLSVRRYAKLAGLTMRVETTNEGERFFATN